MHVIGVPVIENCKRGMKKQVGKSQIFTKDSLKIIQDKMRNACIKSYNKFYGVDSRLKTKQKGRNQDINVNEMGNYSLNQTAKKAGVKNFDRFHNAGYKGLYNGETADDIAKRKGLRYREDILDNMGSEELAANLFRITQTESRLKRGKVDTEKKACDTHNKIGKIVRKAIKEAGGTMPEDLPTPKKSLKQLEKEKNKSLKKLDN